MRAVVAELSDGTQPARSEQSVAGGLRESGDARDLYPGSSRAHSSSDQLTGPAPDVQVRCPRSWAHASSSPWR